MLMQEDLHVYQEQEEGGHLVQVLAHLACQGVPGLQGVGGTLLVLCKEVDQPVHWS